MVGGVGDDGGDQAGREHRVVTGGPRSRGSRTGRALPGLAAIVVHVDAGQREGTK